jgi:hypothetical protein
MSNRTIEKDIYVLTISGGPKKAPNEVIGAVMLSLEHRDDVRTMHTVLNLASGMVGACRARLEPKEGYTIEPPKSKPKALKSAENKSKESPTND